MIKKLMVIFALVALFASVTNAQWTNEGAWPDSSQMGATHGIAVDPDGKIWWNSYYRGLEWIQGQDTVIAPGIVVYNPDGTEASFSPIITIATGGGFVVDTITHATSRGLSTDENGNIVYTRNGSVFKINYQTGEGISKADIGDDIGSSPTNAAVADDGTIFIGPVVGNGSPGTAIAMYDTDLNFIGNAVVGPPAIARTMQVSADGNTIYWTPFTAGKMYIYTRADEFSSFALADSVLEGMITESTAWNKSTGNLWISNAGDNGPYTDLSWYAFDPETKTIVDSLKWIASGSSDEIPRGLAFSPAGDIAYLGTFSNTNERMQRAVLDDPNSLKEIGTEVPSRYELSQNYPNPFNPSTVINFSIPTSGLVTVKVFNTLGQEVAELVNDIKSAGSYTVSFDASNLTTGVYVYTIRAGNYSATKKMMLLK